MKGSLLPPPKGGGTRRRMVLGMALIKNPANAGRAYLTGHRVHRDEDGQALIAVIIIFFIAMVILGLLTVISGNEVVAANQTTNRSQAQAMARAGFDELFSTVVNSPNYFSATDPNLGQWKTITSSGVIAPCPTSGPENCYEITAVDTPATASKGVTVEPETAIVQVNAKFGCNDARTQLVCAKVAYRATLVRRNYLDYLYFENHSANEANALIPACQSESYIISSGCLYPAFQGNPSGTPATPVDVINGPFHTNSPFFLVCNNPKFTGAIEYASGGTGPQGAVAAPGNCTASLTGPYSPTPVATIPMPTLTDIATLAQIAPATPAS
jgi:hypothetical protein